MLDEILADGCLKIDEAVKFIGLGKSTLYGLMDKGDLLYVKIGRRRLIPKRALIDLAKRNMVARDGVLEEMAQWREVAQ